MAKTWSLNFFLLESTVVNPTDALADPSDLNTRSIKGGFNFTGVLYYKVGDEHEPAWAELVKGSLTSAKFFPKSQSISAVLFIKTVDGNFAYTFGIGGRSLLKPDVIVPDFGKKVVLSIVDPQKGIRSMDLRTMREQPFLTRQHAARGTRLPAFGVDTLQDHLRAVTGQPLAAHAGLANRVTGADALAYRAKVDFKDLGNKSDQFLAAFKSNAYKNVPDFKWVDQITLIRSPQQIKVLDALMLARVQQQDFDLTPFDIVDWGRSPTFSFTDSPADDEKLDFISASDLVDHFGQAAVKNVTLNQLKETTIFCFYEDEARSSDKWPVYECIELDLVDKGQQFTFGAGRWSVVEPDFLKTVNDYVTDLATHAPALPVAQMALDGNLKGDKIDEAKYIVRICGTNAGYAKIHKCGKEVSFGGNTVELCDVYDINRDLIHLKVWSSSQTFSALAMQASNSSEFLADRTFLAAARGLVQHVEPAFTNCLPDNFQPRDHRIVFGLIRRQKGEIPFFSRLTLMRAAQRVSNHYFVPVFARIQVQ